MNVMATPKTEELVPVPGGRDIPVPDGVDPALFKRRMGRLWCVTVKEAFDITPRMRRVRVTGGDLAGFTHKPGQEIILRLSQPDGDIARRHYTIRRFDPAATTLDIDFVMHGSSVATAWARGAKPGDRLDFTGPRGRVAFDPEAEWHLFVGDETCIPGILSMLESVPTAGRAFAFIEVGDRSDQQNVSTGPGASIEWLDRNGAPAGPSRILADRLAAFEWPAGRGRAYVIGETSNARTMRRELIARGFPKQLISAEGYWRPGRVGGHDHVDDEHA
jgi:NADPH-dependent ferric siderophore reductase